MPPLDPVLCYVDGPWAYFTTQALDKQWGDDWNDAPYEHNAGEPYAWREGDGEPWTVTKVAWDGPFETPADVAYSNSRYSVQEINAGAVAWLRYTGRDPHAGRAIQAGTTLSEFRRRVREAGGRVFEETL